jgi:phosphatidylglycerophosphate synthase
VARKYGKVSDLGGALDTVADNTLIFIVTLCLGRLMGVPFYWLLAAGVTAANVWYLWKKGALVHHTNIKQSGTFLHNIYRLGVNNNAVVYLAAFAALVALL